MTREESAKVRREFNHALATSIESNLDNDSAFVFQNGYGEDAAEDVVKLRIQILKGVVRTLRFRGGR